MSVVRAPESSIDGRWQRRALVVSYLFPPSTEMGAQACAQIARHLPFYGWTPVVLTACDTEARCPSGEAEARIRGPVIRTPVIPHPFTIYRRLKARLRLGTEGAYGESAFDGHSCKRSRLRSWVLSLLAVPDTSTGWIPSAVLNGLRLIRHYRIEHLFSSGPPWTSHLVGLILARLSGLPWTAHFRDPWIGPRAEMEQSKPVNAISLWLEAALERMVVRQAGIVVCVTDEHAELMRHVHPEVSTSKVVTIPNGFDEAEWESLASNHSSDERGEEASFVITYAGTLYNRRTPVPLFRAVKALIDAGEVARDRILIDLLGWCDIARSRRMSEFAAEYGIDGCVRLAGPLGRSDTLRRMMRSNLLLLLAEGLIVQVPGKTYEYLRARRPILALAPEGAVSRLLRRTGGAWIIDPWDEAGIAGVVGQAYRAWSDGRELPTADPVVVASFDRRLLAGRFAELFERSSARIRGEATARTRIPEGPGAHSRAGSANASGVGDTAP